MKKLFWMGIICAILILPGFVFAKKAFLSKAKTYANTYGEYDKKDLKRLKRFDVVVIDPIDVPNKKFVKKLQRAGVKVLAYVNVGQAEKYRSYWDDLDKKVILGEDPNWPDNFYVNANDVRWHNAILNEEIPDILNQNAYDGVVLDMLDTVDIYPETESGMISLIKEMRDQYPDLLIVPNRGFAILNEIYPYIDAFKYEEMCSRYSFKKKKYVYEDDEDEQKILKRVLKKKKMTVLVLDHVKTDPKNYKMARRCFNKAKKFQKKWNNKFFWYGNSVNQNLPIWNFLPFKRRFQKGMSYAGYYSGVFEEKASNKSLKRLKKTGNKWVALVPVWYQDDKYSTRIYKPRWDSPTNKSVKYAIRKIHLLGMKVMLKPMADSYDGTWRALYEPTDFDVWFKNYSDFILHFAKMGEKTGVEKLVIGCEYSFAEEYTKKWKNLIKKVRKKFNGEILYAADWKATDGKGGYENVGFWKKLDYIGIDAYFNLTDKDNPSVWELRQGWKPWLEEIEDWRESADLEKKDVVFTEIGYGSYAGSNKTPWAYDYSGASENQEEQANCYRAFFREVYGKDWLKGVYWWWWDNPSTSDWIKTGEDYRFGFTPKGKEAEDVLKYYY